MHFHLQLIDDPARGETRAAHSEAQWDYFDAHSAHFVAGGTTLTDDLERTLSSLLFMEFEGWDAVKHFVADEPLQRNGVYREVRICRWNHALGRAQRDFPRKEGQAYWYIRGFGKPGANDRRNQLLEAHAGYFKAYDAENFIVRGSVRSDDGKLWQGSANLIALPSRAAVEDFLSREPFYTNGLYDHVLVERYRLGGRPGETV